MGHVSYDVMKEVESHSARMEGTYRGRRREFYPCCDECSKDFRGGDLVYIFDDEKYCFKCAYKLFADGTDDIEPDDLKYADELVEYEDY